MRCVCARFLCPTHALLLMLPPQRRYNRKLYTDFREELCFRYLNQFVDANAITEPRAKNLMVSDGNLNKSYWKSAELVLSVLSQIECKKIKGFTAAAQEVRRLFPHFKSLRRTTNAERVTTPADHRRTGEQREQEIGVLVKQQQQQKGGQRG